VLGSIVKCERGPVIKRLVDSGYIPVMILVLKNLD